MNYYPPPAYPPPAPEPLSGGQVGGMLALGCLLPLIGPLIALVYGIRNSRSSNGWVMIVGALVLGFIQLVMGIVAAISIPSFMMVRDKAEEAEVKQNLHMIQLSVERYAVDHAGDYPLDVQDVISSSYMAEFPINPFTKQPMRSIQPGAVPYEGEFSYEVVMQDARPAGYKLTAYGSAKTGDPNAPPGKEHVIIELRSGQK